MAETKIYIADNVDAKLRETAMERFGYGRGSISKAVEEAIVQWLRMQDTIKSRIHAIIKEAEKDRHVIAVLLFGSYTRKDASYRDIDIAILIDDKGSSFEELNKYSQIGMLDIRFDISILNDLPLLAQSRLLNEAKIVYVKDSSRLYDYSVDIMKRWSDYKYRFNIMNGLVNV
jgi:predicted nucleotidyltransferase